MTPRAAARDETASNGDGSAADGVEGNHTGQREHQDDGGSAALPVALGAYEHDLRDAGEDYEREERSAGWRESKPMAEPAPIASQPRHVRILGEGAKTPTRRCRTTYRVIPEKLAQARADLYDRLNSGPG
jgi:hypothetical protein